MDNMQAFHLTSTKPEPECTFLTLNLMRRARDMAFEQCCPEPRAYPNEAVRDAVIQCFPDVWKAWREWAGPGSGTIAFDTFVPVRFAAHEGMFNLSMGMLKNRSAPPRTSWLLSELSAKMHADYADSFTLWIAEDANAVVHAVERLALMKVLTFDGTNIGFGEAVTAGYLRAKLDAWQWEIGRLQADLGATGDVMATLDASGCDTLAEYYERFGQHPH
jgi:hypothetical protein